MSTFQFVRQLQKALKSFAIGIGMREQSPCVLHTLLRLFCSCYYCSILRRPRQAVSWRRLETAGLTKCFFFSSGFPSNCNSQHPRYFNFSCCRIIHVSYIHDSGLFVSSGFRAGSLQTELLCIGLYE